MIESAAVTLANREKAVPVGDPLRVLTSHIGVIPMQGRRKAARPCLS